MEDDKEKPGVDTPQKSIARWGQDRRLAFIDSRLRWEGRINRGDLTEFFGISVPQASLDIARYLELAPENLNYDRSSRFYQATSSFSPISIETHAQRYLNELLALETGILAREASFIGTPPPFGSVPNPGRVVESRTLAAVLQAIRETAGIKILYQSISKPEPAERIISPRSIAFDGFRWHVRAYCHIRRKYIDFVMGRIIQIVSLDYESKVEEEDVEWNTFLTLEIVPNPNLSAGAQRVIELDYGMENGQISITCRQALLFYTLKRLGLNQLDVQAESQHIVLKNRDALSQFLQTSER